MQYVRRMPSTQRPGFCAQEPACILESVSSMSSDLPCLASQLHDGEEARRGSLGRRKDDETTVSAHHVLPLYPRHFPAWSPR